MAINWDWEKRKPMGLSGDFKNREMLWLWCRLCAEGYDLDASRAAHPESRANHLIDKVQDRENVQTLRLFQDECFSRRLDDSEFNWINFNDRRMVIWITEMLEGGYTSIAIPPTNFDWSDLIPKEQIQLAFDWSAVTISNKKKVLSELRQIWSSLIEIDPALEWLDKKNDDQCRWLMDEIWNSDIASKISPQLRFPVNNEDRFIMLVNALDRSEFPSKMKKLFLNDLKSKWNRRQRPLNERKVQCNLNVDLLTKKNIKRISEYKGVKMGELIDALVSEEIERLGGEGVVL